MSNFKNWSYAMVKEGYWVNAIGNPTPSVPVQIVGRDDDNDKYIVKLTGQAKVTLHNHKIPVEWDCILVMRDDLTDFVGGVRVQ